MGKKPCVKSGKLTRNDRKQLGAPTNELLLLKNTKTKDQRLELHKRGLEQQERKVQLKNLKKLAHAARIDYYHTSTLAGIWEKEATEQQVGNLEQRVQTVHKLHNHRQAIQNRIKQLDRQIAMLSRRVESFAAKQRSQQKSMPKAQQKSKMK